MHCSLCYRKETFDTMYVMLYIDPGTGSMLFTVLLGLIDAAFYSVRMLFIKLRFSLSGGKAQRSSDTEDKDKKESYVRIERSYGSYERSFDVSGIDTESIGAKYENGVLILNMPKKEPVTPPQRQLTID